MAPLQTRKRKSDVLDDAPNTPTGSPALKKLKITQAQKQALIDNLQLEITERARHLRAHYALQCADLRSRIERRINRVPISMRTVTMGELLAKHSEITVAKTASVPQATESSGKPKIEECPLPALPQPTKIASPVRQLQQPIFPQAQRARKRKSSEINIVSDKENDAEPRTFHDAVTTSLPVQKNNKRAKSNANGTRTASRSQKNNPGSVLSPRSHNSRTLPRSPVKEHYHSPSKDKISYIARPSPLKQASPFKSAASAASSAISAAAHGLGSKLTRPGSRDRHAPQNRTSDSKMLPPARPVHLSSPQRTTSQSSTHTVNSEQSTTSSAGTVVTKAKRGAATAGSKIANAKTTKATTTGIAVKKTSTAAKAMGAVKRTVSKKETTAGKKVAAATVGVEPVSTGRVLRKRN